MMYNACRTVQHIAQCEVQLQLTYLLRVFFSVCHGHEQSGMEGERPEVLIRSICSMRMGMFIV